MKTKRIDGLDIFRGFALVSMMIYHFVYDLNYFEFISIEINSNIYSLIFRYTIISMFLLSVGMSLALAHKDAIKWKAFHKRSIQLLFASLAISITTYITFSNSWVYFGILHFILLASLITLPFLNFPKITLVLSLLILIAWETELLHMHWLYNFFQAPLALPLRSQDLIPLFPWLAVVFIGTVIVHYDLHQKIFNHKLFTTNSPLHKLLKKMGQNSLVIYLIHQPILFLGFELFIKLSSK